MKKILIVEDDEFLINAYRLKLEKAGFEIKIAEDGIVALEVLKSYVPDLIVLDLVMPRKDGFAVLEDMQKDENLKKIPVLVASNLGQKEDVDRSMALGAVDYVVKSEISLEDLVKKILKLIEK